MTTDIRGDGVPKLEWVKPELELLGNMDAVEADGATAQDGPVSSSSTIVSPTS